jgi:DNA (cytosine-5)-methyltransferase 1
MKKYKILNLYACLGGNRYKWDELADNLEITAVELDPELARMYEERFPNDIVIVADAHQYLLEHYKEFDFIWTSPPCPSHTRINTSQKTRSSWKPKYPSMILYEEILFLENFFFGKYCVENVIPYYNPLIPAKKRDRHLYWTNFNLPNKLSDRANPGLIEHGTIKDLEKYHEIDLSSYKGEQSKTKIGRNLVDYEAGKTILSIALNSYQDANKVQGCLF